jgi:hypothetical protein
MKFTVHQWNTTSWVCITVGMFGWAITDKLPPQGMYIGVAVVLIAAAVALGVRYNTEMPPPVPVEEETENGPVERKSPYFMTIRELIETLERFDDDSAVVLDSNGHPVSNVLASAFDEDFSTSIWLAGFSVNRGLHRLAKATDARPEVEQA